MATLIFAIINTIIFFLFCLYLSQDKTPITVVKKDDNIRVFTEDELKLIYKHLFNVGFIYGRHNKQNSEEFFEEIYKKLKNE